MLSLDFSRCGRKRRMSGFLVSMEGAVSQGIVWGIMVLGVYITYKILDIADLTLLWAVWCAPC